MAKIGATIEELDSLKIQFNRQSENVEQLLSSIRDQLSSTDWLGGAADRFRDAWSSKFEPTLRELQNALTEAATEVQRRAEALVQAGG